MSIKFRVPVSFVNSIAAEVMDEMRVKHDKTDVDQFPDIDFRATPQGDHVDQSKEDDSVATAVRALASSSEDFDKFTDEFGDEWYSVEVSELFI